MEGIKKQAEDFMRMCEERGLAATMAISDPNDTEEKGFVGNTGPIYSVLANIAGILLAIEKDSGAPTAFMLKDIRAAINRYKYGGEFDDGK